MIATDVELPRDKAPDFPARCVRCGSVHSDTKWTVADRPAHIGGIWGYWGRALSGCPLFGRMAHAVDVPICAGCLPGAARQRTRRQVLWSAVSWGLLALLVACVGGYWVAAAILAPLVVGTAGWLTLRPACFDMTVRENEVEYSFRDLSYAREFAEINRGKIDG